MTLGRSVITEVENRRYLKTKLRKVNRIIRTGINNARYCIQLNFNDSAVDISYLYWLLYNLNYIICCLEGISIFSIISSVLSL